MRHDVPTRELSEERPFRHRLQERRGIKWYVTSAILGVLSLVLPKFYAFGDVSFLDDQTKFCHSLAFRANFIAWSNWRLFWKANYPDNRSAKLETLQEQQQQQHQQQRQQQRLRDQQQQQQQQRPIQRQPIAITSTSPPVSQITERQLRQRQHSRTNYHEDEYGPASEVESDRQQRVYRGQPSTIGQVQRDRDGLRRNIISVSSRQEVPNQRLNIENVWALHSVTSWKIRGYWKIIKYNEYSSNSLFGDCKLSIVDFIVEKLLRRCCVIGGSLFCSRAGFARNIKFFMLFTFYDEV